MRSDVNLVQVVNNLLSMAWIQMDGIAKKYVSWKNLSRSNFQILGLYAIFVQICFAVIVGLTLGTKLVMSYGCFFLLLDKDGIRGCQHDIASCVTHHP